MVGDGINDRKLKRELAVALEDEQRLDNNGRDGDNEERLLYNFHARYLRHSGLRNGTRALP